MSNTRLFVVMFSGEVMGYLGGRTMKGTAARYAAHAGLDPNDADLKLVDVTSGIPRDLQVVADLKGTVRIAK